jgi:hypothetical protein
MPKRQPSPRPPKRRTETEVFPPIPLPRKKRSEAWGDVCCVYKHDLGGYEDKMDTYCHFESPTPLSECCDESRPGWTLTDWFQGTCDSLGPLDVLTVPDLEPQMKL